jgi:hypothetical protein
LIVLLVLSGDSYVNNHATIFRQSVGDRRERKELYCGARGDYRRDEQSGPAILLGIALGFGAYDQQHDVGRDRLAGLDVGMKCFDESATVNHHGASQFLIEYDLFGKPVSTFPDKRLLQTRDFIEVMLGAALPGE